MSDSKVISGSSFYAIISPSVLKEQKLKIPENFVDKYANELSRMALMAVPNGHVWRIGLNKDGNSIWFQDNWKEFVEYYSIKDWYFLVFKFRGLSTFHVVIFDMTASEIRYRVSNSSDRHTIRLEDVETDHANGETHNSCGNSSPGVIRQEDEESDDDCVGQKKVSLSLENPRD